jgi:hypothetical protein
VWVLTTGLNSGVSKLIGQGIHRHILLNETAPNPIVLGMTSWGTITEYTRSLLKAEISKVLKNIKHLHLHFKITERLLVTGDIK